ncbi:hypothetical protein O181_067933 [Austropuccinia psidii MF-1]|uniref:Hap4 transcription factor heteromerisation domain-containing protein n=1 Tax=Austropuccinia psidii MF-1 TaxID=1389203 RepID=A0A9Q3I4Z9_9BASI|nr:hypothetical protein [Austropuccinia psidii MF-1]
MNSRNPKDQSTDSKPDRPKAHSSLILPDIASGEPSKETNRPKSFVTQEWTIPDRPKPGRKPKPKPPRVPSHFNTQKLHGSSTVNAVEVEGTANSIPVQMPSMPIATSSKLKNKDLIPSTTPQSLQQTYIDSLEAKIVELQKCQSDQVNYYKTLASQSNSKCDQLLQDNHLLHSQMNVLRAEVLRLRKRISQLVQKLTQKMPIVINDDGAGKEAKVRKQSTNSNGLNNDPPSILHGNSSKKLRRVMSSADPLTPAHQSSAFKMSSSPKPQAIETCFPPAFSAPSYKKIPDFSSNESNCGLCTSELDCVCRQVGLKPLLPSFNISEADMNNQLAIPIKARPQASRKKLWVLTEPEDSKTWSNSLLPDERETSRECSGNPRDCPACCDDPFGQAFCAALNNSNASPRPQSMLNSTTVQTALSDPVVDAYVSIPCCGNPELCGSQHCFESVPAQEKRPQVSCSAAWRQLKAHPNIGHANLQLLADVVARKSTSSLLTMSPSPTSTDDGFLNENQPEKEDSYLKPHATLATVFENMGQSYENPESLLSCEHHSSEKTSPESRPKIKFVEQQSLDEALEMLDRAGA